MNRLDRGWMTPVAHAAHPMPDDELKLRIGFWEEQLEDVFLSIQRHIPGYVVDIDEFRAMWEGIRKQLEAS